MVSLADLRGDAIKLGLRQAASAGASGVGGGLRVLRIASPLPRHRERPGEVLCNRTVIPSTFASPQIEDALQHELGRPVDLVERRVVEASPNYLRRRLILTEAEPVYPV